MLSLDNLPKLLLIIGGIAWGIVGVADINIVEQIFTNPILQKIIYILVGLSAVLLLFNRDYYLPFLGRTVVPFSFFKDNKVPDNATFSVDVKVPPNARVIYWAAEPLKNNEKTDRSVQVAYGEFKNSGITTADATGNAKLTLRLPDGYTVKSLFKKQLKAHVHYRYSLTDGMLSEILTTKVDNSVKKEKFTNDTSVNIYENDIHMFDGLYSNA